MLLAVLEKRAGFKLSVKDVFLNMAGGLKVNDPACDLAVISAVLSSNFDLPVPSDVCFCGEVGLSGEIRPVAQTERRIIASENWWKLRNSTEEQKDTNIGGDGGFKSVSGWLHNVITSKHADAMDSYPEPNILPREKSDESEAKLLSSILLH